MRSGDVVTATVKERVTTLVGVLGTEADHAAAAELMPLVYDELRALARRYLRAENPGHTLQPTALVHEAYLKLVDQTRVDWRGRSHFRAVGAQAMRRILVDHARRHATEKRGGGRRRVTLSHVPVPDAASMDLADVIALEAGLKELATLDARQARVLELRFYGDLPIGEIGAIVGVSKRTVEGDLAHGRAWLRRRLATKEGA
jgi:RNA polymerase sigma factor (TIGR02999 family)